MGKGIILFCVVVIFLFIITGCAADRINQPVMDSGALSDAEETADHINQPIMDSDVIGDTEETASEPIQPSPHEWLNLSNGLVAHGGGSVDGYVVTNSKEAILTNYREGHRVFEIDVTLTTDGELVCVHDWPSVSGPLSEREYLNRRTDGGFTPVSLRDVYEIMTAFEDMYMITDTKSFEYSESDARKQFERLYTLAVETDASLLDRIIPQIYDRLNYETLTAIYPFKSVIYTLYATADSDAEILSFVKDKADIAVVAMGRVRNSAALQQALTEMDKRIYYYTLNSLTEIMDAKNNGIHGFYTDFIIPVQIVG